MPSEGVTPGAMPPESSWGWLSSQGLGVLCGQATVVLLGVGSIVLAATRDGASARILMDDLRAFFVYPSFAHLWLYLLVPVLGLYALNTALATWESALRKWRSGVRLPQAYAAAVMHVAFLTALCAHVVGGLGGAEGAPVRVGPTWEDLDDGRHARLVSLDVQPQPDGSMKQVRAELELRDAQGTVLPAVVRFNEPLSSGLGTDLLLLARPESTPGAAHLVRGGDRCRVELDRGCDLGGVRARLLYLHDPARHGMVPLARVELRRGSTGARQTLWLAQGRPQLLADGSTLSLEAVEMRSAILLRRRHAPGNPWAFASALLLCLGLALMWRRLV